MVEFSANEEKFTFRNMSNLLRINLNLNTQNLHPKNDHQVSIQMFALKLRLSALYEELLRKKERRTELRSASIIFSRTAPTLTVNLTVSRFFSETFIPPLRK